MASRLWREHLKDLRMEKAAVCVETANSVVSTDNREIKRETETERADREKSDEDGYVRREHTVKCIISKDNGIAFILQAVGSH